jgi:protein-S-isoprenylcysteine O-methyltransferase Ste14
MMTMGNSVEFTKRAKVLPPTYLVVFILVIITLHYIFPIIKFIYYPWNLIGTVPIFVGIVLNLAADRAFKKIGTTVKPYEESTGLLVYGTFKFSRHPMYLGMALILLGLSILLGSLTPFAMVAVFVCTMEKLFVQVEEQMMENTFGSEYLEYKKKVRKWV